MSRSLSATEVRLVVAGGQRTAGTTIPVTGPAFVIGRDPGCQLRPRSPEISRRHAQISLDEDEVTLRDLDSRNGTTLNGKKVSGPTPLEDGDRLILGPLEFVVSIATPPEYSLDDADSPAARQEPPDPRAQDTDDDDSIFDDDSHEVGLSETVSTSADDMEDMVASFLMDRKE